MPVTIALGSYPPDIAYFLNFFNSIDNKYRGELEVINRYLALEPTAAVIYKLEITGNVYLKFESEEDFIAFKLRWS